MGPHHPVSRDLPTPLSRDRTQRASMSSEFCRQAGWQQPRSLRRTYTEIRSLQVWPEPSRTRHPYCMQTRDSRRARASTIVSECAQSTCLFIGGARVWHCNKDWCSRPGHMLPPVGHSSVHRNLDCRNCQSHRHHMRQWLNSKTQHFVVCALSALPMMG